MNTTLIFSENWFNTIPYDNLGAALFIISYIGFYGLCIMCMFGHQLKETERQRHELPSYFLETLWNVPNKNKLYRCKELADVERLKHIFRGYFADHETYTSLKNDELQMLVDRRAHACAVKYRHKLRRLHLDHTEYYLDTLQRSDHEDNLIISLAKTSTNDQIEKDKHSNHILSISVV